MDNELRKVLIKELKEISKKYAISINNQKFDNEIKSLKRTKKLDIPYFYNIVHFCKAAGFSQKKLLFYIYHTDKVYTTFEIDKKNGGMRKIDAPIKELKMVQRWILDNILYKLDPGKYAYGFIPNRTIKNNAKIHVNQELICGIDIKDYFPSITSNRVWGFFKSIGYNNIMTKNFTELTTYQGRIPQGAPTSPMIANLISWKMDMRLAYFCEKRGLNYSRYADDITISGSNVLPKYMTSITRKIQKEGFTINKDKLRIIGRGSAQKITGVVVNDTVSIGRDKKRRLKAIIHNISKNGPIVENRNNDPFFKERIFGELGYAKMINPDFADPLIKELKEVNWKEYDERYISYSEEEKFQRDIKKSIKKRIVNFTDLGFFKDIPELKILSDKEMDELSEELKLLEKCCKHDVENCQDCLIRPKNNEYKKCLKYILGQYIQDTGGHHHGNEIYDIAGDTEFFNKLVFVIFLLKSYGMTTAKKDSLFRQFYTCIELDEPDVVSIATPDNLDHELKLLIRSVVRKDHTDKDLCLILRPQMLRIYSDFKKRMANTK